MTRATLENALLRIFRDQFEIDAPGFDDDLREVHGFDSIDAIELLREIEILLGSDLSQEEKKSAMQVRTLNDICNWVLALPAAR